MTQAKFKPKLRLAPTPEEMAERQEAARRLLALEEWSQEPLEPAPETVSGTLLVRPVTNSVPKSTEQPAVEQIEEDPAPVVEAVTSPALAEQVATPAVVAPPPKIKAKAAPEVAKKPWEIPDVTAVHPYYIICPERLFQKMDFLWKRDGSKSMKEWVIKTLEAEANKGLKALGE
jgi:hypothetical protein